jgi:uncharacterized GH25 family protein
MKKTILLFLIILSVSSFGHEFWIQPDKFIYKRGETINLKFLVGENFDGKPWTGNNDNISFLHFYYNDVVDRKLDDNVSENQGDSLQLAVIDEGTMMMTLNTKNSFIDLEAKEFNSYLADEGLTEALEYRKKNGDTAKNGTEFYQRSVKTIFQVGENRTHYCKKKTALPLDIIPDDNPYSEPKDGNFKLKVLFQGKELKKTKIKVWHKVNNKVSVEEYTTNDDGEVKIFLSLKGEWMVSCVKMIRLENDMKAEWQSYWGSLTWGYY